MKHSTKLIILSCLISINSFAGGTLVGGGTDGKISGEAIEITPGSNPNVEDRTGLEGQPAIENQIKGDAQVYYMGENGTEVQFATNIKGSPAINVKRVNPKINFSDELFQGLKESQETGAWVELKKSHKLQIDNFTKEAGAGKFRGGLNGIGGGARGGF